MFALDLIENLSRRFGWFDGFGCFCKRSLFVLQLRHANLKKFFWRKIDQLSFSNEASELFPAEREIGGCLRQPLAFQPTSVIGKRGRSFAIGFSKFGADLFVSQVRDRFN